MKILNMPLGSGKTTALVKMMLEPGNEDVVFVAPTKSQAEAGYRTATTALGMPESRELERRFISASELPNWEGRKERYVIDEIDGVLRGLVGGEVIAITGTDEDEKKAYRERNNHRGVKADSKGRLTGAQPGTRYILEEHPDGTITFSPAPITEFDDAREVTESQFEEFFGVRPGEIPENQGIVTYRTGVLDPGYLPVGIVVTQFVTDSDGNRRIVGGVPEKKRTLIRIVRD